mgnify:CR=1 FL=1
MSGVSRDHINKVKNKVKSRLFKFSEAMSYSYNLIKAPIADEIRLPRIPKHRKIVIKRINIQNLLKQIERVKV